MNLIIDSHNMTCSEKKFRVNKPKGNLVHWFSPRFKSLREHFRLITEMYNNNSNLTLKTYRDYIRRKYRQEIRNAQIDANNGFVNKYKSTPNAM